MPFTLHRIVNQFDLTPHLPPKWVGFLHTPLETYIQNVEGDTVDCPAAVEEGKENKLCANKNKLYSVSLHGWAWDVHIGIHGCLPIFENYDDWL